MKQPLHRRTTFNFLGILWITAALLSALAQDPSQGPKGPWLDKTLSPDRRAELLLGQMTLDEKLTMVHGGPGSAPQSIGGAGYVAGIPRLGVPAIQMTDGRSGVANTG